MKNETAIDTSVIQRNPVLRWLFQPRRIPLLFAVTVISGIFYHYSPKLTILWIVLSLLFQGLLFKLFDYVNKHHVLGGIAYLAVGAVFMFASLYLIRLGYSTKGFGPTELNYQLSFFVWFLTPQSVLATEYFGYTLALFCFFTFFIASIAYYFTFVRYRVLMSFAVMIFPFAIYAKENETMPVPSIIILLVCYFAVMIYCRQAHAEDAEIVQKYEPDAESRLSMPSKKSAFAGMMPEMLDSAFLYGSGIFIAAATILILVIPKPEVKEDRSYMDGMLDMSALSDILMNAISGFTDTSDPTNYGNLNYSRTLYYVNADEILNLRMRTFTDYHYDDDNWSASEYDKQPPRGDNRFMKTKRLTTMVTEPDPGELYQLMQAAVQKDPGFAEKWGLTGIAEQNADLDNYYRKMQIQAASYNRAIYPGLYYVKDAFSNSYNVYDFGMDIHQSPTGILYRYQDGRIYYESCDIDYFSDSFANTAASQALTAKCNAENWGEMLADLQEVFPSSDPNSQMAARALEGYQSAMAYAGIVQSETPEQVRELAAQLTAGKHSDYEKAIAIQDYLRYNGGFTYSLDFRITKDDDVSTFLFKNKTGVCVQFASAMTELCRAAGLPARYVEGYSASQPDTRLLGGRNWKFAITTDEGHAFSDVYIAGYGWLMLDATTSSDLEQSHEKTNILATLQYSGLILFVAAALLLLVFMILIPYLKEAQFRRRFRRQRNAESVQAAFARLRRQWKADPAATARDLCQEKGAFLQMDLSGLQEDFEHTVYADRCDAATADRVYRIYCAAYDAWKPAVRRQRKAERAMRKAQKKQQIQLN